MASRYHADHVGSLLRPQELLDARKDPHVTREQLAAIEDRHILDVLKRQKEIGLRIFTDGELRRTGFMSDFYESVDGLDQEHEVARAWKGAPSGVAAASGIGAPGGAVVAKLHQTKRLTKHEVGFLKQHAPGDIKITLPTANQFPALAYKKGVSERAYPTYSEFLWDIVPIIKAEIHALVHEGIKYHPAGCAAVQLLHRPEVAAAHPGRDGRRSGSGARRSDSRRQRLSRRRETRRCDSGDAPVPRQ